MSDNYEDYAEVTCPECRVCSVHTRIARDRGNPCPYCGYDLWCPPPICCMPDCGRRIAHRGSYPVCDDCGMKIALRYMSDAERWSGISAERQRRYEEDERARRAMLEERAQVYYVRLDPDRIKIGYSANLRERIKSFRVPLSALLACEPGGRDVEAGRHRQFRAELTRGREEFHPSERLLAWVEQVRADHGLPPWATQPDTTTVTVRSAG